MNHPLRTCLVSALAAIVTVAAFGQVNLTKYKERADAVRSEVWGWKEPAFANRTVPADLAGESCVIIARKAVIEADSKKHLDWGLGSHRNYYYNSTVRELVKINDKVSLEEYSALSYRQFKKLNGWMSATTTTFVGARIIKPDGSVKEVNTDETVTLNDTKTNRQAKLAISDLQVGDMLDFYVRTEEASQDIKEPERLIFYFGDDHPIVDFSLHCEIGNKYVVEYRSMNKAPEARQSTNEDKDLILDIGMKHIPAAPTGFWMAPVRELPAFRLNVLAGGIGRNLGDVVKDPPLVDYVNMINAAVVNSNGELQYSMIKGRLTDLLRTADRDYRKLPADSLARLVYYAYRFMRYYNKTDDALEVGKDRNDMDINSYDYLVPLQFALKHLDIKATLMLALYKHGPDIQHIMGPGDMTVMLRVNLPKPIYFTCGNMFTCPGYIPAYLEGQPCPEVHPKSMYNGQVVGLETKLPLSTAEDNQQLENLEVKLNGADMQLLHIKRHTVLTGKAKESEQLRLLNFEDCYESERTALHVEKSIMDELKKVRKSKNVSEDYATALQKARASLKDRFKEEISSEFEKDPKEVLAWKVDNPGLRSAAPDMIYSTEFTLDGLMQRAGNNFILNIGKVVNSPLKLTPSQRTRNVDIYMSYARTLDCTVSFLIPDGYTVQGVDKLNKTLNNDCGSVITSAKVQGSQLVVHFQRVYKHDREPVGNWSQLLAIIDASTDFAGQKVLLKKG